MKLTIRDDKTLSTQIHDIYSLIVKGLKAGPVVLTFGREQRTLDQNKKMWPMLTDISQQVEWYGLKVTPEDWKDIASAAFNGSKLVPGIDGGFVQLGVRTKKFSKEKMSEFIEYLYAFGAEKEVKWSEDSLAAYESYREAA